MTTGAQPLQARTSTGDNKRRGEHECACSKVAGRARPTFGTVIITVGRQRALHPVSSKGARQVPTARLNDPVAPVDTILQCESESAIEWASEINGTKVLH